MMIWSLSRYISVHNYRPWQRNTQIVDNVFAVGLGEVVKEEWLKTILWEIVTFGLLKSRMTVLGTKIGKSNIYTVK